MKKWLLIISILFALKSYTQIYPFTNDYLLNLKLLIPSAGAKENFLSFILTYDKKWILPASPNKTSFYFNANFRNYGFNFGLQHNQIVIFSSSSAQLGYYYKIIFEKFKISVGLNGYIFQDKINQDKLSSEYLTDPSFDKIPTVVYYPQVGISTLIFTENAELGLSISNILKARGYHYGNLNTIYPLYLNFYGSIYYQHPLNFYLLKAQVYSYYSLEKQIFVEPSAIFVIKNLIKAGGLINFYLQKGSSAIGMGLIFGIRLKNYIAVNYVFRYIPIAQAIAYTRVDNSISITFNLLRKTDILPRYF